MIEAVNSVLANAPYTKAVVEQQSVVRSFAANPARVQEAPQAPYISPYIHMDVNFDKAVLLLRDADTGDVVRQIPTEGQLEAYRRAQNAQLKQSQPAPTQQQIDPVAQVSVQSSSQVATSAPTPAPAPQVQVAAPVVRAVTTSETSYAQMAGNIAPSTIDTQA